MPTKDKARCRCENRDRRQPKSCCARAPGQAGEKISAARERIQASLATAKVKLGDAERAALEQAKKAAKVTDEYVQDNPWRAVGIAAFAGLVLGVLISRR